MVFELVFTSVAGFLLFREPFTLNFLVGGAMIVGSGVGLNLMNRRLRRPEVSLKV
jgi:drug/metabolite transporter (DMT)-like permease